MIVKYILFILYSFVAHDTQIIGMCCLQTGAEQPFCEQMFTVCLALKAPTSSIHCLQRFRRFGEHELVVTVDIAEFFGREIVSSGVSNADFTARDFNISV